MSQHSDNEIRALRQLVNELRAEPTPEIDWDRVERGLLERTGAEQRDRRQQQQRKEGSLGKLLLFVAAAAAALVLTISSQDEQPSTAAAVRIVDLDALTTVQESADTPPAYQVSQVGSGSTIVSGDKPRRFTLPGVASWTLAAHSRATIKRVAAPHVLVLEKGSVHAEVVPRKSSNQLIETFAVEADSTRVAVHGTVFSVARSGERVVVEVRRGAVTVGPASHRGITTGHLLVGPSRASFSLDGGRVAQMLEPTKESPPAVAMAPPVAPKRRSLLSAHDDEEEPLIAPGPAAAPSAARVAPPAAPSAEPTADPTAPVAPSVVAPTKPRALTVDEARAMMVACLSSPGATPGPSGSIATVSSQVTVALDGDHKVATVRFVPPLRPDLQMRCAGSLFGRELNIAGSAASFRVHFAAP